MQWSGILKSFSHNSHMFLCASVKLFQLYTRWNQFVIIFCYTYRRCLCYLHEINENYCSLQNVFYMFVEPGGINLCVLMVPKKRSHQVLFCVCNLCPFVSLLQCHCVWLRNQPKCILGSNSFSTKSAGNYYDLHLDSELLRNTYNVFA